MPATAVPLSVKELAAKADFKAREQACCPHMEFELLGGQIRPVELRSLGRGNIPSHLVCRLAPQFSYRCTICGMMIGENQHDKLYPGR